MTDQPRPPDQIGATITGNVSGQVAVGRDIAQSQKIGAAEPVTAAEREELGRLFAAIRAQVEAEAPEQERPGAIERIDELEQAVTADEPDVTTMVYVKRWFRNKLPTLAGLVTGILVNPIVGKLVQSVGDAAVAELDKAAQD